MLCVIFLLLFTKAASFVKAIKIIFEGIYILLFLETTKYFPGFVDHMVDAILNSVSGAFD